jgi:hypothetical protein
MLTIRPEQMDSLQLAASQEFVDFMVGHLREHFPMHAELWGPEPMRQVIGGGLAAGCKHKFQTGRDLCLYIDFCVMLGIGFDTDVQLPWAGKVLRDPQIASPTERIDRLYQAVRQYLEQVVGKDQAFPVKPMEGVLQYPVDQLRARLAGGVAPGMLREFREIWPQKYRQVGEDLLARLIQQGIQDAARHGFTENRSIGVYLILMYLLGHRFDVDPQYPWLAAALKDPRAQTPAERFDLLHTTGKAVLSKALGRAR